MNKFQKLAQLNQDIELLEAAGKIKAADILHKKFIREAQADPFMGLSEIAKKYMTQLELAYSQQKPIKPILDIAYNDDAVTINDKNILAVHADKIKDQYSASGAQNVSNYVGYQTPQSASPSPKEDYAGQNTAYQMASPTASPSPTEDYAGQNTAYQMASPTASQPTTQTVQQPTSPVNSDTANEMQARNTMPAESPIYQQAINQIANLLNTKTSENRDKAQQIYENTIGQFKDPKRKQLFAKQFQAIVSRNFPAGKLN
jgi:hypothetical protein